MGSMVRGSNPSGSEIFRTCPDQPLGPPSLLYNGYQVFPRGKERPGHDTDPSSPSSAVGHERVELYLYSPYGPYGLYRVSVPVQGCTLPLMCRYKDDQFLYQNSQPYPKCIIRHRDLIRWSEGRDPVLSGPGVASNLAVRASAIWLWKIMRFQF